MLVERICGYLPHTVGGLFKFPLNHFKEDLLCIKVKKYVDSAKTIDRSKQYDPAEALSAVVSTAKAKFDETIELHVKLGVDSPSR